MSFLQPLIIFFVGFVIVVFTVHSLLFILFVSFSLDFFKKKLVLGGSSLHYYYYVSVKLVLSVRVSNYPSP